MSWWWAVLTVLAIAAPLLLGLAALVPGGPARGILRLAPAATVPAAVLALAGQPVQPVRLPWLLLGVELGMDPPARVLLLLTAGLWFAAGAFAQAALAGDPDRGRFGGFWLLTMSGNLALLLAGDAVTFYAGFAVMTYAAYGLVVHDRTEEARRAGRAYLALAVLGEALLLVGLLAAVAAAGTAELAALPAAVAGAPQGGLVVGLLLAGFGIKAGTIGLHLWLPLAHPAAPVPASAVLSGCIIKAGLLGWLRFLPLGEVALPGAATACLVLGLGGAFGAVALGVGQPRLKVNLAYSSVSQMGLLLVLVGLALAAPGAAPALIATAALFALHHGLAKGALFLGVGMLQAERRPGARRLVLAGLALAALSLAGAPLTSGGIAKTLLKQAGTFAPGAWPPVLEWLLPLTSAATALLLGRFLLLAAAQQGQVRSARPEPGIAGRWVCWSAVLVAVLLASRLAGAAWLPALDLPAPLSPVLPLSVEGLWDAAWPLVVGLGLLVVAVRRATRWPLVPPGDLVVVLEAVARGVGAAWRRVVTPAGAAARERAAGLGHAAFALVTPGHALARVERLLVRWRTVGVLIAVLLAAFAAAFVLTGSGVGGDGLGVDGVGTADRPAQQRAGDHRAEEELGEGDAGRPEP